MSNKIDKSPLLQIENHYKHRAGLTREREVHSPVDSEAEDPGRGLVTQTQQHSGANNSGVGAISQALV